MAIFGSTALPSPLTHFRLLAHSFAAVSLAVAGISGLTIDAFLGEHYFKHPDCFDRLKTAAGHRVPVIPDGLFILRRSDGKRRFIFIEADTGSENLGRIIRKIHGYEAYRSPAGSHAFEARYHAPPVFTILFVTVGRKRAANLRRTVAATAQPERRSAYRFATTEMLPHTVDAAGERHGLFE